MKWKWSQAVERSRHHFLHFGDRLPVDGDNISWNDREFYVNEAFNLAFRIMATRKAQTRVESGSGAPPILSHYSTQLRKAALTNR